MRIVAALGGNALLRRGEPMTAEAQERNVAAAVASLAPLAAKQDLVVTHGNGPQVGLLAQQSEDVPLDVLDAETEGMIGYLIARAFAGTLIDPHADGIAFETKAPSS
jgi:carbamate kinase